MVLRMGGGLQKGGGQNVKSAAAEALKKVGWWALIKGGESGRGLNPSPVLEVQGCYRGKFVKI